MKVPKIKTKKHGDSLDVTFEGIPRMDITLSLVKQRKKDMKIRKIGEHVTVYEFKDVSIYCHADGLPKFHIVA